MAEYPWKLMGLVYLVDLLLLMGAGSVSGVRPKLLRCMLGAMVGSVLSGLCLRQGASDLWRLAGILAMAAISYGPTRKGIYQGGMFVIWNLAMGGLAACLGSRNLLPKLLGTIGLWLLFYRSFRTSPSEKTYEPVRIAYAGKEVSLLALLDTGNSLRDPVTGEQVMVVSAPVAQRLTGLSPEQLAAPMETLLRKPLPGLRLIPYRTIAGNGMLLGLRIPEVYLRGGKRSAVVAFAAEDFCKDNIYQALTGGTL